MSPEPTLMRRQRFWRRRYYRLTDENSVLQFLPHSGVDVSRNQTSTNVQNAITATQPDITILMSSPSACFSHFRICLSRQESGR
jgi:hypothetical protein